MRKFIDKILDIPKLIRRIWIILWLLLGILLVMKFCFGIWYPIVIENEWFLKLNDLIKISWIKYLILSIFYLINANLLYLISCTKKKYINITEFTIINALSILSFVIKCFNRNFVIITEILISVIIPIIFLLKTYKNSKKILLVLFPIIAQILAGQTREVDALYDRLKNCPVGTTPVYGNQPIFTCPVNVNGTFGCGCNGTSIQ